MRSKKWYLGFYFDQSDYESDNVSDEENGTPVIVEDDITPKSNADDGDIKEEGEKDYDKKYGDTDNKDIIEEEKLKAISPVAKLDDLLVYDTDVKVVTSPIIDGKPGFSIISVKPKRSRIITYSSSDSDSHLSRDETSTTNSVANTKKGKKGKITKPDEKNGDEDGFIFNVKVIDGGSSDEEEYDDSDQSDESFIVSDSVSLYSSECEIDSENENDSDSWEEETVSGSDNVTSSEDEISKPKTTYTSVSEKKRKLSTTNNDDDNNALEPYDDSLDKNVEDTSKKDSLHFVNVKRKKIKT
ncbi:hypothetical protein DPMN_112108 [Dreissena polymorpha]|uniref:Uncharacterized protein n=1 Tax=Dreissena polymorpha TaxID=45954 RepID=A0A9D4QQK2_DREPO|nr:hypothetical protein DPMN_112108 [Dreissena polymorpha]